MNPRESLVVLVAALGHHVKHYVGADELLDAASVGVEHVPAGGPIEDADASTCSQSVPSRLAPNF